MIWTLIYLGIGMALAWNTCSTYPKTDDGWAEALGDFTGFLIISLLWLPIVAYVVAAELKHRAWPR